MTQVVAAELKVGDVVRIRGEQHWWEVYSMFFEGPGIIDIGLLSLDEEVGYSYNWHVSAADEVERWDAR